MAVPAVLNTRIQVPHLTTIVMSAPQPDVARMSQGNRRAHRGSWAEQRVVAMFAINNTMNATRITTTPPTVSRSHRPELSRARNSLFPVITMILISNSIELDNVCSDQDHMRSSLRSRMLKCNKDSTISQVIS
jgi:hypothetical protein